MLKYKPNTPTLTFKYKPNMPIIKKIRKTITAYRETSKWFKICLKGKMVILTTLEKIKQTHN